MFLTEDLLKKLISEIRDEYLTQLPSTADAPISDTEASMDAFTAELEEIEIDPGEGVHFMGKAMNYDEFLAILGNYIATREQRRHGGQPDKYLRKEIKAAVRDALVRVPQMIADAIAEVLEDRLEDDSWEYGPESRRPMTPEEKEDWGL